MKGWKTWTGAIGMVATTVVIQYFGGDADMINDVSKKFLDLIEAARVAFGAMTAVGIGHKIEKGPQA